MRTIVLSSTLIAFSVACGYAKLLLFPYLFFVELFTLAVFLSGALIGPAWGLWVGALARLLFSVANPYGPPHPWVLGAQVIGAAAVGGLGGALRPWLFPGPNARVPGRRSILLLLVGSGLLATSLYDLLTNLAQGVVFGSIRATLALAALPWAQHVASNAVMFGVVGTLAIPWLRLHPAVLRHDR
jgi:hypothetical protein